VSLLKLGEGEEKIAEYFFKGDNDVNNMSILTNRRLIVLYKNAEESFPLSKITAVRVIFKRSIITLILGNVMAIIGVFALPFGIILIAIGAYLAYLGAKGKTQLLISQIGGEKYYRVKGKDKKLIEFMDAVNSKLS